MKIALLQMNGGIDPARNRAAVVQAIADAAAQGARLLFTPEMSNLLDRNRERAGRAIVSESEDAMLAAVRDAARRHDICVHLGSIALSDADGMRRNRGFAVDAHGDIRARYDKIHLFDVALGSGDDWQESRVYRGGDTAVVTRVAGMNLGLSICYDLRFPALYQALSANGADVIAVPSAFTVPTGQAHWHVLLRARAIETSCFVVAAAQCGTHEDGRSTYGHSLVVDPWGEVLLDMGEAAGLAIAEIDLDMIADVRRKLPSLANRREIRDCLRP